MTETNCKQKRARPIGEHYDLTLWFETTDHNPATRRTNIDIINTFIHSYLILIQGASIFC